MQDKLGHQPTLRYGVIALGDSSYENFCGAGKRFDALLQAHQAKRIGDVLLIDATEDPEPESVTSPGLSSGVNSSDCTGWGRRHPRG